MRMRVGHAIVASALLAFGAVNARATTINFDDVASGTNINTQYLSLGVTFGCFNGTVATSNLCSSGNAYAVASPLAESASNVISFTTGLPIGDLADERYGYFKASFSSLQSSVSIDAKAVMPPEYAGSTTNKPFLQAYNSSGGFLGETLYSVPVTGQTWETLTFTSSTNNIAFVAFSSFAASLANQSAVYGTFDNLTFNGGTTGGGNDDGGTPVPEPASIVLLGGGLLGLVAGRKRLSC